MPDVEIPMKDEENENNPHAILLLTRAGQLAASGTSLQISPEFNIMFLEP